MDNIIKSGIGRECNKYSDHDMSRFVHLDMSLALSRLTGVYSIIEIPMEIEIDIAVKNLLDHEPYLYISGSSIKSLMDADQIYVYDLVVIGGSDQMISDKINELRKCVYTESLHHITLQLCDNTFTSFDKTPYTSVEDYFKTCTKYTDMILYRPSTLISMRFAYDYYNKNAYKTVYNIDNTIGYIRRHTTNYESINFVKLHKYNPFEFSMFDVENNVSITRNNITNIILNEEYYIYSGIIHSRETIQKCIIENKLYPRFQGYICNAIHDLKIIYEHRGDMKKNVEINVEDYEKFIEAVIDIRYPIYQSIQQPKKKTINFKCSSYKKIYKNNVELYRREIIHILCCIKNVQQIRPNRIPRPIHKIIMVYYLSKMICD